MFFSQSEKKKRIWPYVVLVIFLIVFGFSYWGYVALKNLTPEDFLQSEIVQKELGGEKANFYLSLTKFLGFDKPMTYLVLFENNTELRPGGGFIGVYAVLKIDKGNLQVIKVDGTENLDRNTPADWKPTPPEVLTKHLKVDRWYFRDSNWSPDFSESAKKALEFYKAEGGVEADNIDMVVAFTPTVVEKLLDVTGGFTVDGIEFTADNVTEKLEYEVEYGYGEDGTAFSERKQIIRPFMEVLLTHLQNNLFSNLSNYENLFMDMTTQKQIMFYSPQAEKQEFLENNDWDGQVVSTSADYLLWVDANLASLKTDYAMNRELKYSIRPNGDRYIATVEMIYKHNGKFDWRTSRYRTYARVFVPVGSEWISTTGAMKWDRTAGAGPTDKGIELGKQWFGAFIAIEPSQQGNLKFEYYLSAEISQKIKSGQYDLYIQKQLGTIDHALTLNLDFGKNILTAKPAEMKEDWGDMIYKNQTNLREDRQFSVSF